MHKKNTKLIITLLSIALLVSVYFICFRDVGAEDIRNYINSYGYYAPIIYILLFTFLPIAFFPVPVLALAAGLAFGLLNGTIYTIIGAGLNSAIMFFMAKFLARDLVVGYLKGKLPEKWTSMFDSEDSKKGFIVVFILRLIPIAPYNVINYGAGLTSIGFVSYIIATLIGILPGTLVFLNIGDKAIDISDPKFLISIVLLILLTVISLYLAKKVSPNHFDKNENYE